MYVLDIDQQRSWGIGGGVYGEGINTPAISPDGRQIAFTALTSWQTSYDVYIMNIDGTNRQRVTDLVDNEHSPSWTYDGKQILFHTSILKPPLVTPLYRQSPVPNPTDRMLLIDFGFIDIPEGPVSAASDGKLVVSANGIRTMNADGSNFTLVIPRPPPGELSFSPAWSPDGKNVALLLLGLGQDSINFVSVAVLLYAADWTAADTLVTLPASGRFDGSADNRFSLCWSPDGSQIAFTRPDGQYHGSHIFLINKNRTGLTQVTFAEGVADKSLSWSH
jgi:Tol biopolymer transport system component